MKESLLLIDGNSLIYRAYYATASTGFIMKSNDGTPTNAIHGIANMFINFLTELKPHYALVAFDHGKKTKRHDFYAQYKANRQAMPEELVTQMPMAKELCKLLGLNSLSIEEIEADDIIGTLAKTFSKNNYHVTIISSDNDMLQLVDQNIKVLQPAKGGSTKKEINNINFSEAYLPITPDQIKDLKAIMGDSSDNLPGIKGIGPKGALKLIQQYGSLEEIIKHVNDLPEAISTKILKDQEMAILCKKLATIDINVSLNLSLNLLKVNEIDKNSLNNFLDRYQLFMIKEKVNNLLANTGDKLNG